MTFTSVVSPFYVPLLATIFSILLCQGTIILSLVDHGQASRYLNLISPLFILVHHSVVLVPPLSAKFSTVGYRRLFTACVLGTGLVMAGFGAEKSMNFIRTTHDKLPYNYGDGLITYYEHMRGCILAQSIVQMVQIMTTLYIVAFSWLHDNCTGGRITLPSDNDEESQPLTAEQTEALFERYGLAKDSPFSLWFLLTSTNISAMVLFLSALDNGHRSHGLNINIFGSTIMMVHNLSALLFYMDKIEGPEVTPIIKKGNVFSRRHKLQILGIATMLFALLVCSSGAFISLYEAIKMNVVLGREDVNGSRLTRYMYHPYHAHVSIIIECIFASAGVIFGHAYIGFLVLRGVQPSECPAEALST